MRHAIGRLLEASGFDAHTFASEEALLEAGTAATAACLVLDVRLPGTSGFQLYGALRRSGISPPVIFITAHDEPSAREQAERADAVAYLPKPFPGRHLVDAVNQALARTDRDR